MNLTPFETSRGKKLSENANRPILFENVSYEEAHKLSKEGKIPVGGKWVATLGIVFGAER